MQDCRPDHGGRLYGYPGHRGSHLHHEILSLGTHLGPPATCVSDSPRCVSDGCWQNCKECTKERCFEDIPVEDAVNEGRTQDS